MGAEAIAAQWRELREPAAGRGRTAPIQTVLRTNPTYTAKPFEGPGRRPFQGSVDQTVEDLAAEPYEKARAAGI